MSSLTLTVLCLILIVIAAKEHYNILSLDGGGVRGLITVRLLTHFEKYAYEYSTNKGYQFPQYDGHPGVIHMKDLFNMAAGTSTGSFISAGLGYSNGTTGAGKTTPKYFGQQLLELYTQKGDQILYKPEVDQTTTKSLIFIVHVLIWGFVFYKLGKRLYDNDRVLEDFEKMHAIIDNKKRTIKDIRSRASSSSPNKMSQFVQGVRGKGSAVMNRIKSSISNSAPKLPTTKAVQAEEEESENSNDEPINVPENALGGEDSSQAKSIDQAIEPLEVEDDTAAMEFEKKNQDQEPDSKKRKGIVLGQFGRINKKINNLLKTESLEQMKKAKKLLNEQEIKYNDSRPKKWVVTGFGIFIGACLGITLPQIYQTFTNTLFDRSGIEKLLGELVGGRNISDSMFDDLLIVAYEYNSQQPRFYSKYFAEHDPGIYDVNMALACGGSSAVPGAFEPQQIFDEYGTQQLIIDGGIISNNPSLIAYLMSKVLNKKDPIRIVSLGTGVPPSKKINPEEFTKYEWLSIAGDLAVDIDTFMTDQTLSQILSKYQKDGSKNYLRLQAETTLDFMSIDAVTLKHLEELGDTIYVKHQDEIKEILEQICDEKFGSEKAKENSSTDTVINSNGTSVENDKNQTDDGQK